MRLRLCELQENNKKAKALKSSTSLLEDWKDVKKVLQYRRLPYVPEIIYFKVISHYHDDLLARYFGIDKIWELVSWKYYWLNLKKDVKVYIKGCDVCLTSKAVKYKPYRDLQSLSILTHQWKNFSIDFVTSLLLSADWKGDSYDSILVIVNQLTKMVHYKPIKVTINAPRLAKVILNIVIWHYSLLDSIVTDRNSFFTSKFWSSLYSFFGVKWRLSTAFYP